MDIKESSHNISAPSDEITQNDKHFLVNLPNGELLIAERIPPKPK